MSLHELVLYFLAFSAAASARPNITTNDLKLEQMENSVDCLNKMFRYKKRPQYKMKIKVQVGILSIDSLSSRKMELTTDVYLTQEWVDKRCRWKNLPGMSTLTLYSRPGDGSAWTHSGLDNLWQPDTQVLNSKKLTRPETVYHLKNIGFVQSRTRLSLTASCPMDLRLYPMDRQICSLKFQSAARPKDQLTYEWKNASSLHFVQGLLYQDRMTPDLRLLGYKLRKSTSLPDMLTGEEYEQFIVDLYLERPLGFFLWEVYMPASFIVAMSFTSFWLDRAATPARVSLGVTTVLTITTLLSSANNNLPPTAYPKAIGVFLAGCFLFTFLALMEYSVASYLERRRSIKRHLKLSRQQAADRLENGGKNQNPPPRERRLTVANLRDTFQGLRPAAVDVYSRFLFPLAFLLFHITYWTYCFLSQPNLPDDIVVLKRNAALL